MPADFKVGAPIVDTSTSEAAATIEGDVNVPKNRQLLGFYVKLGIKITESGVSTGSSFVGETLQSFKAKALDQKEYAIDITEGSALQLAAAAEWARQVHDVGQDPIANQVIAASATEYWMYAYLVSPFAPSVRQAKWTAQLKTIVMVNFSAPTAYSRSLWVAPIFSDKYLPAQRLQANAETNTRVVENDVLGFGVAIDNVELSTVMTTMQIGQEEISSTNLLKAKENLFNTQMTGMNTAFGTPTQDLPAPGIIAPWHATQRLFGVTHEVDEEAALTIKCTSAALKWFVRKPWSKRLDED
jgi:hypothetical protein